MGSGTIYRLNSAGGGGFEIVTVSGTINDSNLTFTSATEPTLLVINGLPYRSSGDAITWSYSSGTITLSAPVGAGGGIYGIGGVATSTSGANVETPSGTINGSNTVFTVVHEPSFIIVDGLAKFLTTHYTYAALTITITDGAPPALYIRSFY